MRTLKKVLKIVVLIITIIFIGLYIAFIQFSKPKSDTKVLKSFQSSLIKPILSKDKFRGFNYRKIELQKDTVLPTIIFVHGTIGSLKDFSKYMTDSLLQTKANMISYDRIGYGFENDYPVQESIAFERDMLLEVIKEINPEKVILVGYSYGGPIVLSATKKVKKVILLAPALFAEAEVMPFAINVYKSSLTRWMIPKIWQKASQEKLSHAEDLLKFQNNWQHTPNTVVSIHGEADWIVPYKNSIMLMSQMPKEQFELVTLKNAGHGLVWTDFEAIKKQLLKSLD